MPATVHAPLPDATSAIRGVFAQMRERSAGLAARACIEIEEGNGTPAARCERVLDELARLAGTIDAAEALALREAI